MGFKAFGPFLMPLLCLETCTYWKLVIDHFQSFKHTLNPKNLKPLTISTVLNAQQKAKEKTRERERESLASLFFPLPFLKNSACCGEIICLLIFAILADCVHYLKLVEDFRKTYSPLLGVALLYFTRISCSNLFRKSKILSSLHHRQWA